MKLKKLIVLSVASLATTVCVVAQEKKPAAPAEAAKNPPAGEPGHVHDENCNHGHAEQAAEPTVDEIRAFLKTNAAYILPEFDEVIKAGDKQHIQFMTRDVSRIMAEHASLKAFKPELAALFIEVFKLENDLHVSIEKKLAAGEKPEAACNAVKPQLKVLISKRLELEKGQIAYQKHQLDNELKDLEGAMKKVDEITAAELKQIIDDLKQTQQESKKDSR